MVKPIALAVLCIGSLVTNAQTKKSLRELFNKDAVESVVNAATIPQNRLTAADLNGTWGPTRVRPADSKATT